MADESRDREEAVGDERGPLNDEDEEWDVEEIESEGSVLVSFHLCLDQNL